MVLKVLRYVFVYWFNFTGLWYRGHVLAFVKVKARNLNFKWQFCSALVNI